MRLSPNYHGLLAGRSSLCTRNFFGMRSLDEISLIRSGPFPYSFARLASALSPYLAVIDSILYIPYQLSRVVYGGGEGGQAKKPGETRRLSCSGGLRPVLSKKSRQRHPIRAAGPQQDGATREKGGMNLQLGVCKYP